VSTVNFYFAKTMFTQLIHAEYVNSYTAPPGIGTIHYSKFEHTVTGYIAIIFFLNTLYIAR